LPDGYVLQYEQDFSSKDALRDFVMTDPQAWTWSKDQDGGALELVGKSQYQPPHRSPLNIALLDGRAFGDFILEADFLQTGREYGHRDMCLFFGFQDPANFYYAHVATKADPNAHNVFRVQNAPRTNIDAALTKGVNWGLNEWHTVRLQRNASDGSVKVFFDDMANPILAGKDQSFGIGHIGFGSFDDTGKITRIRIWAPTSKKSQLKAFSKPID
jgi:hypothetical protein